MDELSGASSKACKRLRDLIRPLKSCAFLLTRFFERPDGGFIFCSLEEVELLKRCSMIMAAKACLWHRSYLAHLLPVNPNPCKTFTAWIQKLNNNGPVFGRTEGHFTYIQKLQTPQQYVIWQLHNIIQLLPKAWIFCFVQKMARNS